MQEVMAAREVSPYYFKFDEAVEILIKPEEVLAKLQDTFAHKQGEITVTVGWQRGSFSIHVWKTIGGRLLSLGGTRGFDTAIRWLTRQARDWDHIDVESKRQPSFLSAHVMVPSEGFRIDLYGRITSPNIVPFIGNPIPRGILRLLHFEEPYHLRLRRAYEEEFVEL